MKVCTMVAPEIAPLGRFSMRCINQTVTGQIDARHEKTDLKVFVVVIPKEGWARGLLV